MIASLWVVVFATSSKKILEHALKFLSIENVGKASVGVASLPGASAYKHWQERRKQRSWEKVTGRGSYTTRESLLYGSPRRSSLFQGL